MIVLSQSDIHDFQQSAVWLEMLRKISDLKAAAERLIENPDSFEHGKAVGQRHTIEIITGLPEQFLREIRSGGKPTSVKPV